MGVPASPAYRIQAGWAGGRVVRPVLRNELFVGPPVQLYFAPPVLVAKSHSLYVSVVVVVTVQYGHASWRGATSLRAHHVTGAAVARDVLQQLPPGSLVVNATGLGKDSPGSPLPPDAIFPERAFVWEFNYRGDLVFLEHARAQQVSRKLHVEDGWTYFLHGWTRVISDVFNRDIPTAGPVFADLGRIAADVR